MKTKIYRRHIYKTDLSSSVIVIHCMYRHVTCNQRWLLGGHFESFGSEISFAQKLRNLRCIRKQNVNGQTGRQTNSIP